MMKASFRTGLLGLGIMLVLAISACAPQTPSPAPVSGTPLTISRVSLADTEVRAIKSSSTGRDYDIYVGLPGGYAQNQGKKYPVLYVLDGQWDFKLLESIYGGLLYDQFVPEMIVVGITYSGDSPDYGALRAMDYTPIYDRYVTGSGGAPQFLAFVKQELIPFIETNYRADSSQRVLMGSSFGGSFTLFAMFSEPGLFSGYVAASPAVDFGQRAVFQQEAAYASQHKDLPVRLFLSVGSLEQLAQPVQEFMQVIG
jgi:predicted alpha/beta superfamily hydrolase